MILVGLTGGIGSGKSTVSALLAERGAVIIDADAITRELQAPGAPLLDLIAARFGPEVIDEHGALDRPKVAAIVFHDPAALKDLNGIVHPAVGKEIARRIDAESGTEHIVVMDIPLLTENPNKRMQGRIVVDVPLEVQVERLVHFRGFSEDDVRARIANQATREQRLADADQVIDNGGSPSELIPQIDRVWAWLGGLPHLAADPA